MMRTITERPLLRLSTRTRVPNGKVRCAATSAAAEVYSPLAVFPGRSYQVALPHCVAASGASMPKPDTKTIVAVDAAKAAPIRP